MKKIGILIPCYNEEENIELIYNAIKKEIDLLNQYTWKIIYVDNASADNTVDKIRNVILKDKRVCAILNQANYGPYRSTANGIYNFDDCEAVIDIAADLEEPPELIPLYLEKWEQGNKVILSQYKSRQGNCFINLGRKFYYKMLGLISDTEQLRNVTGAGLYDKSVINEIQQLDELEPKFRYLVSELGYEIVTIPYDKPVRKRGKSSYNIFKYYREAIDSIVGTSKMPLHIASLLGFLISGICFIVALFYLIYKLIYWDTFVVGTAPIVIGIFFIGGLQLFFIGIIGEYLGEVLKRVTKRPTVIEKRRINFMDDNDIG